MLWYWQVIEDTIASLKLIYIYTYIYVKHITSEMGLPASISQEKRVLRKTRNNESSSSRCSRKIRQKPMLCCLFAGIIIPLFLFSVHQSHRILKLASFQLQVGQTEPLTTTRLSASSNFDKYVNNITGKFAYSFVISGCDTATYGGSCTAYVLNAIIAATVLRYHRSTSDIIIQVRMLSTTPHNSQLSPQLTKWLTAASIQIRYLPRVKNENFATATLEKFRVLELVDYDRVYFLDGDLIPLTNIDYHMEMSYRDDCQTLQKFVGYQDIEGPINSGSMIVTPSPGLFEEVMNIVNKQRNSEIPFFDEQVGWGHTIQAGDEWRSWNGNRGKLWNYWGVHYDQGLQYHFFKYKLGSWTYLLENGRVENWEEISKDSVERWKRKTSHVFPIEDGNRYIAKTSKSHIVIVGCNDVFLIFVFVFIEFRHHT